MLLEYLLEHATEVITIILVAFFNLLGRPKSAEQVKKANEKLQAKLEKKSAKLLAKSNATIEKLDEVTQELKKED